MWTIMSLGVCKWPRFIVDYTFLHWFSEKERKRWKNVIGSGIIYASLNLLNF